MPEGEHRLLTSGDFRLSTSVRRLQWEIIGFVIFPVGLLTSIIVFGLVASAPTRLPTGRGDGIVALSGDPERVERALELLSFGYSPIALLTGLDIDIKDLRVKYAKLFECCIELDVGAGSTRGDASAIQLWVRRKQLRSIIVVTSSFHMPRAIVEIKALLPQVQCMPAPVRGSSGGPAYLELVAREFTKFLFAWAASKLNARVRD